MEQQEKTVEQESNNNILVNPMEAAAKHSMLLTLLDLTPANFISPITDVGLYRDRVWFETTSKSFYRDKGKIKIIGEEQLNDGNFLFIMELPRILRKKNLKNYEELRYLFNILDMDKCQSCYEDKGCDLTTCLIKEYLSGHSCWLTPQLCTRNPSTRTLWGRWVSCLKCEYYKKPHRLLKSAMDDFDRQKTR